ncbi:MAG: acyl carrier protein [Clostridiales bacterium]|jgi:acyl carrier protein|nr:acyl carrier protein [Clostridiales bacterium]
METLLKILEELHPDVDFENCETLIDDNILDSFDIVTLVGEINEEYDINIPPEELIPENFNSAKSIYALIERLIEEE